MRREERRKVMGVQAERQRRESSIWKKSQLSWRGRYAKAILAVAVLHPLLLSFSAWLPLASLLHPPAIFYLLSPMPMEGGGQVIREGKGLGLCSPEAEEGRRKQSPK